MNVYPCIACESLFPEVKIITETEDDIIAVVACLDCGKESPPHHYKTRTELRNDVFKVWAKFIGAED